ncbi:MAG: protoporphyrinogen oxidase [Gemmatimonadetes bacterium]|nr:protoporphyrinogen oxidase [Gemmatimonadota bacterium]
MIVIVGGGISGLALARELAARGTDFVLLEASARVGGVIRSGRVDGHLLDWGPQRTRLTRGMTELIAELGLGGEVVAAPPGLDLFVYRRGRLRRVPFSAAAFLASDIVGPAAKLRAALEPLTAGADPDESVARYFTRKFGRELYETLIGPLYGGLYASDPEDMVVGLSLLHVLREFGVGRSLVLKLMRGGGAVAPPPACSFRGGMEALPKALAAALGARVRTSTPVESIHRAGAAWEVATADETFAASVVVLAVPAPAAARLLAPLASDAARKIGSLRYNPLGVVHLHADTDLRGMGFQVSFAEPLALRGVTYNDSLFGRSGVYTAYLGGGIRPEVVGLGDDALARLAVDEFRLCTGYASRPLAIEREEMPAWDRSWSALHGLELPAGIHLTANWESRPGLPGRLARALSLADQLNRPLYGKGAP